MANTEVAKTQAGVPDLVRATPLEIEADDIVLPRIKIGHPSSAYVEDGLVKGGDIYAITGQDDPDPEVLWEFGSDNDGPTFHVLAMRKGKSDDSSGELVRYAFDDPDAPAEAWTTYNYVLAVPEVDPEVPFKLLLTKSGRPAAQQINTILRKAAGQAPWATAFTVKTAKRENTEKRHKWYVPQIRPIEAKPENVEIAEGLAVMVAYAANAAVAEPSGDEPAI